MKAYLLLLVTITCLLISASATDLLPYRKAIWSSWKRVFHQKFTSSPREDGERMRIFFQNMAFIRDHNKRYFSGLETYATRLNQFSAMTPAEFKEKYLRFKYRRSDLVRGAIRYYNSYSTKVPASLDWREKGYVTNVKDQGSCGSCWAFSATGSLEGALKKKTGKLVSLSEQQLVDCSTAEGNEGCNGGLMENAFEYLEKFGIESEKDYPYVGRDKRCAYNKSLEIAKVKGYFQVPNGNETQLQLAMANNGPVSVGIDATGSGFMSYSHGIYTSQDCSSTNLDHGVLAVGYGSQGSNDFWIVKNSWSHSWGMEGYILMARNHKNMCGIATMASYPTV